MNKNKTLVVPKKSCDFKGLHWKTYKQMLLDERQINVLSTTLLDNGSWMITFECPHNTPNVQTVIWNKHKSVKGWAIHLLMNQDK